MIEVNGLIRLRAEDPGAISQALRSRRPGQWPTSSRMLFVAADHPARGVLTAGDRSDALADRADLLDRLVIALTNPAVGGLIATPDIVEDLTLLRALDGKVVIGSMNRSGLAGSAFEIDDRRTAYDVQTIAADAAHGGLAGGKIQVRIDPADLVTAGILERAAYTVDALSAAQRTCVLEPAMARRMGGRLVDDTSPESLARAIGIASGLGRTSAYSWLKVPAIDDLPRALRASTLPVMVVSGEADDRPGDTLASWRNALQCPSVRALVIGRSLLYPSRGTVAEAVAEAAALL